MVRLGLSDYMLTTLLKLSNAGGIIELSALGTSIFVINTAEEAYKLLDERGSNYSDRPNAILQGEL